MGRTYRQILEFLLFCMEAFPLWVLNPNQTCQTRPWIPGSETSQRERFSCLSEMAGRQGLASLPEDALFSE